MIRENKFDSQGLRQECLSGLSKRDGLGGPPQGEKKL